MVTVSYAEGRYNTNTSRVSLVPTHQGRVVDFSPLIHNLSLVAESLGKEVVSGRSGNETRKQAKYM